MIVETVDIRSVCLDLECERWAGLGWGGDGGGWGVYLMFQTWGVEVHLSGR